MSLMQQIFYWRFNLCAIIFFVENNNFLSFFKDNLDFDVPDLGAELTDDDKRYLYLKWGKGYTPDEWVRLEQLFNEMMQSYDI